MYEKAFQLEIITPSQVVFRDEATSLTAPGTEGSFQVLFNHAPLLSSLEVGEIKVKDRTGRDLRYATSGGFVEVNDNHVVVLADTAEKVEEIDVERAKSAKARAEERLHQKKEHVDEGRARAALMRAMNRLRLSQRH
ncbi:MAG: F0F1 ATP synthase subunit epsilon [Ignavibacteriae bacterium]|nr:F0F1 ATP synthase subunit epsilon [Ignavibacteriota bacterium]